MFFFCFFTGGTADEQLCNVDALNLRLEQSTTLPDGLQLWDIKDMNCSLRTYSMCWLKNLNEMFPNLQRLTLLCGDEFPRLIEVNDWKPPSDLSIVLRSSDTKDRVHKMFAFSHLCILPLSNPSFVTTLLRLQLCALAHDFTGVKNTMQLISGLKVLKRLGTISPDAAQHLELCNNCLDLEELAISCLVDKTHLFLACLVGNMQRKKRTNLRRVAVHVVCADGLAPVSFFLLL